MSDQTPHTILGQGEYQRIYPATNTFQLTPQQHLMVTELAAATGRSPDNIVSGALKLSKSMLLGDHDA